MDRKRFLLPMFLSVLFLALALASPVYADDPPPPEQPAAPPAAPAGQPAGSQPDVGEPDDPLQPAEQLVLLDLYDPLGGDPYFKVGSKYYRFLPAGGNCGVYPATDYCEVSATDTPIQDAIDYVAGNGLLPSDRIIYVEKGVYNESTAGVVIDGLGNAFLAQLKGLKGVGSSNTILTLAETTRLNTWVEVTGSTAGFTLSGFNITGSNAAGVFSVVEMNNITGAVVLSDLLVDDGALPGAPTGLLISANGAITVDKVTADGLPERGAVLTSTATSGAYGVKVTNSSFNRNLSTLGFGNWGGLNIYSNRPVQISAVSASNNNGDGLVIDAEGGFTIDDSTFNFNENLVAIAAGYGIYSSSSGGSVTIKNTSASSNERDGLLISMHSGDITIQDSFFSFNGESGMYLDTCFELGGVCTTTGAGKVTIKGTTLNQNGDHGIWINKAKGNILLDGVNVIDNVDTGAEIVMAPGVSSTVTVYRSQFNNNDDGLTILGLGAIKVNNVTASHNDGDGAVLNNGLGTGTVTLLSSDGANVFYDNGGTGLKVGSTRNVSLDLVFANDNNNDGIFIDNDSGTGTVTLTRVTANDNHAVGVDILSANTITLNNVTSNGSETTLGVRLNNLAAASAGVTILSSKGANQFSSNFSVGLQVDTNGNLSIKDVTAADNVHGYGAILYANGPKANVTVSKSVFNGNVGGIFIDAEAKVSMDTITASGNTSSSAVYILNLLGKGVTLSLVNASYNLGTGENIYVQSLGAITLKNCDAAGAQNAGGVSLDNDELGGTAAISVTNTRKGVYSDFRSNYGSNLSIQTAGGITLKGVDASSSTAGVGATITQVAGPASAISISDSLFDLNATAGLDVNAYGSVTLNTVSASDNGIEGVLIDNHDGTGKVSLTSVTADRNDGDGINIKSLGAVTISKTNASNNLGGEFGLRVDNTSGTAGVTISGASANALARFDGNVKMGLSVISDGAISLKYVSGSGNGAAVYGNLLSNNTGSGTITITSGYFDENTSNNLWISSKKAVTFTTGSASGSANGRGAFISNNSAAGPEKVTITGVNFNNNPNDTGLQVQSIGIITISKSYATGNGNYGFDLNNSTGTGVGISISGASASSPGWVNDNTDDGIYIRTTGAVTLKYLDVHRNGVATDDYGVYISGSDGAISLSNLNVNDNGVGLYAYTLNKITLTSVTASENLGTGIYLTNLLTASVANTITLTTVNAHGNEGSGIQVFSAAGVTLTNCHASGNDFSGAAIDNDSVIAPVTVKSTSASNLSRFNDNDIAGVSIQSNGAITLTNLQADDNESYGINVGASANTETLSLSNISAERNGSTNVNINHAGNITWTGGVGSNGSGNGIMIDNSFGSGTLTLSKLTANANAAYGISIVTKGVVMLKDITTSFNVANDGLYIQNNATDAAVTLSGANSFIGNGTRGAWISILGDIAVSGVLAANNGNTGLDLWNNSADTSIVVQKSTFRDNGLHGMLVQSVGTGENSVTLANLKVTGNGYETRLGQGIWVIATNDDVKVTDSIITGNYQYGINAIIGTGTLTLDGCSYLGNNADGAFSNISASGSVVILP